jgi:teichuronic acid exporter
MPNFKKTIIVGTIWSIFGQMSSFLIILITNIWMARLLSPNDFGRVGVIMFFVSLANVFSESGLGGALVRKKNATIKDYSTVFVSNLVLSLFCFLLIFVIADYIAYYYNDILLKKLLIVSSLVLIINSFQLTQNAKLVSAMKFKEKAIYGFISVFVSSVLGIYLAYKGFGIWALILIQLFAALINTILLWLFEGFFLKFYFSISSFKDLYSFGINTTIASLINTGFDNIYQLILAKYFSLSETGYFYQAKKIQEVPGGILNMITQSVVFSSLAKLQDDVIAFNLFYNKISLYFLVLLGFISSMTYIYAEPLILILYGKEWIGSVFYMQLLTVASFFYIQELLNRVIFKVFNQTRQILYLEYVKKIVQTISIIIGMYFLDLKIIIIGFVITNIIGYFINYYYSRKIIGSLNYYDLITLLKIILISVISTKILIFLIELFFIKDLAIFFTLPFLILFYLLGINKFKILNIYNEIINLRRILNASKKNIKLY